MTHEEIKSYFDGAEWLLEELGLGFEEPSQEEKEEALGELSGAKRARLMENLEQELEDRFNYFS